MLGHPRQEAIGSALIARRFVVHSKEALRWLPFVLLGVTEGFVPPNEELNIVRIA